MLKIVWNDFSVYPWIDGQILAPAISALPPSLVVVFRKEPRMAMRLYPWMTANTDGSPSTLFTAISSVYKNKIHRRPARRETAVGHNHTPHPSQPVFLSRPHHCRRYYSVLKISLSDADFHP